MPHKTEQPMTLGDHVTETDDDKTIFGVIALIVAAIFIWMLMYKVKADASLEQIRDTMRSSLQVAVVTLIIGAILLF